MPAADPSPGAVYPEWDSRGGHYRERWTADAELDPAPGEADDPFEPPADLPLQRQLARLGLSDEAHRHQLDGEALDLTALVDHRVAVATATASVMQVYETRRRSARDLAIVVLLDATGSTGESTDGKRVFDAQREVVGRLTAALEAIGDRVATYGFYSNGRRSVRFLRVKDFDGRFDRRARLRLRALRPGGFTRLGAAVRHGTELVATQGGAAHRLLVLVGDGLPYDDGYEDAYAQADSRRALEEAVARGVGCVCLSVRSTTDPAVVDAVWGTVAHQALDDARHLSRDVNQLFRIALRAAAANRPTPTAGAQFEA